MALELKSLRTGVVHLGKDRVERRVEFAKVDQAKRIVYGEVYVPNVRDAHGHWMSAEEIEKMAHNFMQKLRVYQVDKQHDSEPDEGVIVESFIAREGDPDFTPGAWVVATKILNEETWQAILKGEITGYSMAGVAMLIPDEDGA